MSLPVNQILPFRRGLIIAAHVALIPAAYRLAFELRFDFQVPEAQLAAFWTTLPLLVGVRLLVFGYFGLYRGYWRHVGLRDLVNLSLAVTCSAVLVVAALFFFADLETVPRSVLILDWLMAIFLGGGMRFAVRWVLEGRITLREVPGQRTLLIGDGEAAEQLLRQFQHDSKAAIDVIGLVDDDPSARGGSLHGVPVLGTTEELGALVARWNAELLVIAVPAATGERLRHLIKCCTNTGLPFKIVPSLRELLDGRVRLDELREVRIEDLLGRKAVSLDLSQVERDIAGRRVLVTGGAGSIGAELARQIARFRPERLILLEQAESPLYFVHLEVAAAHPELDIVPIVGDVTDAVRLGQLFATHRPEYVFHAAAYKHVPLMETNAGEAVRNNVIGTLCVARCAARHGAVKFVLISTDKAVNPSSIMGATKRVAERIVLGDPSLRAARTDFRVVRFGNVLGSDGSVIPLFRRQLATGGPLTVTHPEVQRYFMTIPEAAQLVLEAAALPEASGRIAMLEMGEPVRIADLAEQLIRLSGLVPHQDVQLVYTGLRPGEKLNEELLSATEATVPTSVERVRIVQTGETDSAAIARGLEQLAGALVSGREEACLAALRALVPECVPPLRRVSERSASPEVVPAPHQVRDARPPVVAPALVLPELSANALRA